MTAHQEVRQQFQDKIESIVASDQEDAVILRGLHRFYFDKKLTSNAAERVFLMNAGIGFLLKSSVTIDQDRQIFSEEAQRFRDNQQKKKSR